jgi:hypothetical protein
MGRSRRWRPLQPYEPPRPPDPSRIPDVAGVLTNIPYMSAWDTVQLWRNALKTLADPQKSARHSTARFVLQAVWEEWERRECKLDPDEDGFPWPSTRADEGSRYSQSDKLVTRRVAQVRRLYRRRHRGLGRCRASAPASCALRRTYPSGVSARLHAEMVSAWDSSASQATRGDARRFRTKRKTEKPRPK